MAEMLTKRQLRYQRDQERLAKKRWESYTEEELQEVDAKYTAWQERHLEILLSGFTSVSPSDAQSLMEQFFSDCFTRARNLGLFHDEKFSRVFAEVEHDIRTMIDERLQDG